MKFRRQSRRQNQRRLDGEIEQSRNIPETRRNDMEFLTSAMSLAIS